MERTFIEVPLFTSKWKQLGLTDEDLFQLQDFLLLNPDAGKIMQGTGGIRKLRFALGSTGKSGGIRICYVDFEEYEVIHLITAFAKSEQKNLDSLAFRKNQQLINEMRKMI